MGKWYARWQAHGEAGLLDRSSRPEASPSRTPMRSPTWSRPCGADEVRALPPRPLTPSPARHGSGAGHGAPHPAPSRLEPAPRPRRAHLRTAPRRHPLRARPARRSGPRRHLEARPHLPRRRLAGARQGHRCCSRLPAHRTRPSTIIPSLPTTRPWRMNAPSPQPRSGTERWPSLPSTALVSASAAAQARER
ncbi:leucine zipper domain-containing protein [Streptomyces sp. 067-1]|uniref:leucine zipper domain-containing protein n=1 Tax=Streptomyces sp. 067-1 TaxID=2789269 RepID=UPI0039F50BD2